MYEEYGSTAYQALENRTLFALDIQLTSSSSSLRTSGGMDIQENLTYLSTISITRVSASHIILRFGQIDGPALERSKEPLSTFVTPLYTSPPSTLLTNYGQETNMQTSEQHLFGDFDMSVSNMTAVSGTTSTIINELFS